jgi:aryl-alcohol dehydrogenase-like predicted oxidoreductase
LVSRFGIAGKVNSLNAETSGHGCAAVVLLEDGILTGEFLKKVKVPTRIDQDKLKLSERSLNVLREVQKISEEVGKHMSQVSINRVRQQPKAWMIPILGARRVLCKNPHNKTYTRRQIEGTEFCHVL